MCGKHETHTARGRAGQAGEPRQNRPMTTERQKALATVEIWVRERVEANGAIAHGWLHIDRVRQNIRSLAAAEGVDPVLAEMAALLHDVGKFRLRALSSGGGKDHSILGMEWLAERETRGSTLCSISKAWTT